MGSVTTIAENLRDIRERIARAAEKNGRRAEEIRLVAVTKTHPLEVLQEAIAAGVREIGESYVQEAEPKLSALETAGVTRHFIGHLQKNKAGKAVTLFDMVQSVDSVELAQALGRRAEAGNPAVLLFVFVGGNSSAHQELLLAPKIAVPIRTMVEPSAIAVSKSPVIPIESTLRCSAGS